MLGLFFGCLFISFGPAAVFLLEVVLNHSHLTVLTIVAAFYELIGFLFASVVWFLIPDTFTGRTATALVVGVFLQELMRLAFVVSYGRGEKGLAKASGIMVLPFTDFPSALSSGFGFGLMYALLVYGNVLGQSVGEADYFAPSCPNTSIFLIGAFATLAMQILHVALMVAAFDAWRRKPSLGSRVGRLILVLLFHLLASLSTLINQDARLGGCSVGMPLLYLTVVLALIYVFKIVREPDYRVKGDILRSARARDSVQQSTGGVNIDE